MSLITEKSPKHCANRKELISEELINRLVCCLTIFFLIISVVIFLVWIIVRPKYPQFSIKEAEINQLKLTGQSSLNSSIHVTLLSTNPNDKLGIYYDYFVVYASYNGEKITPEASITPFYQDRRETKPLIASLVGNEQPVGPFLAYELQRDQENGQMETGFKVMGKMRWRLGNLVSKRTRFTVNCRMIMQFGPINSISTQGTMCSFTF